MLQRQKEQVKESHELELRGRISQLLKIIYDQFILCLSHSLGVCAGYDICVKVRQSWAH
jgi:hypothetical protein